jgi:hypothetical protein
MTMTPHVRSTAPVRATNPASSFPSFHRTPDVLASFFHLRRLNPVKPVPRHGFTALVFRSCLLSSHRFTSVMTSPDYFRFADRPHLEITARDQNYTALWTNCRHEVWTTEIFISSTTPGSRGSTGRSPYAEIGVRRRFQRCGPRSRGARFHFHVK